MSKTFVIADLHFGHQGVCNFTRDDGSKLRPWSYYKDMDAALIENWNAVVAKEDKVYVLGDVAMHHRSIAKIGECNGDKVLIKGNHDQGKLSQYVPFFRDIRAYWQLSRCLLSHIPVHPESLGRWRANIHGHTHYRRVLLGTESASHLGEAKIASIDPRYICVSVEHTNYAPRLWDDVLKEVEKNNNETASFVPKLRGSEAS